MTDESLQQKIRDVRGVLLDMDGVLYVGESPLPGVQDFLDYLDDTDRHWLCITNNSTRTPELFVDKLKKMNVRVRPENVLGSAQATAQWLGHRVPLQGDSRGKVIMLGEEGLRTALLEEQFELVDDPFEAEFAVVGINFQLVYQMLADVTLAVRNGARFIGTNPDTSFPSERGQIPGTGSVIALIESATGVSPEIIGKPNRGMYDLAMERLNVEIHETMMVGDRYETDIIGAAKLGMTTVGVLTGISTETEFKEAELPPHIVLGDIPALLDLFRTCDG